MSNKPKYTKDKTKKGKFPKSNKSTGKQPTNSGGVPNCKPADNVHLSGDINDASYYFSNELLKVQLGTISFNDFTGIPINMGPEVYDNVPYALRISLNPSAGFTSAQDATVAKGSGLNLASLATYTKLTAANAKTSNYGPQDITMLFLSLGSLISGISYARRAFGTVYNYALRNRTYPEGILKAQGVAYDDLVANLANYRVRFNTLLNQISKIPVPANVPYFKKCDELYAGLYLDMEGSAMAQTYVFVPESLWKLDEVGTEEGSKLKTVPMVSTYDPALLSMDYILGRLENMVRAMLESSTFQRIYPDILRLSEAGQLPLWSFEALREDYQVLPMYNPEIRKWINNLTIMGVPVDEPDSGYTPANSVESDADTNRIVYRPQFHAATVGATLNKVINFDSGLYTVDDVIYATRLLSHATWETDPEGVGFKTKDVALPDHYVTSVTIMTIGEDNFAITEHGTTVWGPWVEKWIGLSDFDWAPLLPVCSVDNTTFLSIFGDLNYYTTVDYKYVQSLQDATYFGLFEIR